MNTGKNQVRNMMFIMQRKGKKTATHLAYIEDTETDKAISLNFNGGCTDKEKSCGLDSKNRNESFEKIVESLIFK